MFRLLPILILFISFSSISDCFAQPEKSELEAVHAMSDDSMKVKALIKILIRSFPSDTIMAHSYADSAIAISKKVGYTIGIAKVHHELGILYANYGTLEQALKHYKQAMVIYNKLGNDRYVGKIYHNIGLLKRREGRLDEAMNYLFKALSIRLSQQDTNSIAFTNNVIGETYAINKDYEQAEIYFKKAMEGFKAAGNEQMEQTLILNLAGFYMEQAKYEEGFEYSLKAKKYFEENGPLNEVGRSYYILGGIYLGMSELDKSKTAYEEAKKYFDSLGLTMRIIGCHLKLSEVAFLNKDLNNAIQNAEKALLLSKSIGTNNQQATAFYQLYEIYKSKGNYKLALQNREQYELMNDSINRSETASKIAELEKEYESKLKEKELMELKAKNAMNELTVKKQQNQQYGLMGFAFLILMMSGLIFNQYRTKKRNHDVLLGKNDLIQLSLNDKEVLLREIHHRVKNNMQFISSMLNLQSRHVKDKQTLRILVEGKNRINSMALLHQKLYEEDNLKGVEMRLYISNLLDSLIYSYKIDRKKINIVTEIDELILDIDTATPVGLIINELITNVFKYAFTQGQQGRLEIKLKEQDNILQLSVEDNGAGFPENFTMAENQQFGFQLIASLGQKLNAEISICNNPGASVKIKFYKYSKA